MGTQNTHPDDGIGAMVDFARRWLPYGGGPDEEILVMFGVAGWVFYNRLVRVLDSGHPAAAALSAPEAVALRQICLRRIVDRHRIGTGR